MIIRSQDKKTICNFGAGCTISMLGENGKGFLIAMSTDHEDYDLGYYETEDEAMAVMEVMFIALHQNGVFYMPERGVLNEW